MKKIYILIVATAFLFSCNNEEQLGADFEEVGNIPAPVGDFKVSKDPVDFTKGDNVYFEQEFEKSTRWKLILTGLNSGATKTFEYVSTSLDESNTLWDGRPDEPPFFQVEDVVARITFPSYSFNAIVDTFTIEGVRNAEIPSVLFSNFNNLPTIYQFSNASRPLTEWVSDWPVTTNSNDKFPKYDGSNYLFIEGSPWEEDENGKPKGDYVDATEMPSNRGDTLKENKYLPLYLNPDRVYINLAVYNTGTKDTHLSINMVEDVGEEGITRTWDIRPDWDGWKYISIKYSDLTSTNQSAFDPTIVKKIGLVLFSDEDISKHPNRETVSIAIDQLVFSFDSPLGTVNY